MFQIDSFMPTRILFGPGRLDALGKIELPGKKALLCVTADGSMEKLGILQRVLDLLAENGTAAAVFDQVSPNPTKEGVEKAAASARGQGCDFFIGLGGGSSIDTAKAAAILMENDGDLWDYAYTGSGKKQPIKKAAPIVTISTTAGTGTETDPYCVITKTGTHEKLDFAADVLFPRLSIIDPELMVTLPRTLTVFQGFDALFHAAECYITNQHKNRLVDMYAEESIRTVAAWLPVVAKDGGDIEGRTHMAYAADICSGYTQSLINTTSHHIIAQTMGGLFPTLPHGASLIMIAEAYYKKVMGYFPDIFDALGAMMGSAAEEGQKGSAFVRALTRSMDEIGVRYLAMSEYGIQREDIKVIAEQTVHGTGIADVDLYTLTVEDVMEILQQSYR